MQLEVAESPDEKLIRVTEEIVANALEEVRNNYDQKESYHNAAHTQFVHNEALALADALPEKYRLTEKDRCLLRLVTAAHDVRYANPRVANYDGKNERESGEWLAAKMSEHPDIFDAQDIQTAQYAIMATWAQAYPKKEKEIDWREETAIQQNVGENGAPPRHIIAQLLCDADLAGLGSEWDTQNNTMTRYYRELHPDGGSLKEWTEYLKLQKLLLKNHRYFTTAATERYGANLEKNKEKIEEMLSGELTLISSHGRAREMAVLEWN